MTRRRVTKGRMSMLRISIGGAIAALVLATACGGTTPPAPAPPPPGGSVDRAPQAPSELAPNPYTVEQLRAGCTHRVIEYRIQKAGTPASDETWAFTEADSDSVNVTTTPTDDDGKPTAAPETHMAKWADLHKHADFPRAMTSIDADTITTPAGTFACTRYVVTKGEDVKTFWFAKSIAGPPVKMVITHAGEQVLIMTMQANRTR